MEGDRLRMVAILLSVVLAGYLVGMLLASWGAP